MSVPTKKRRTSTPKKKNLSGSGLVYVGFVTHRGNVLLPGDGAMYRIPKEKAPQVRDFLRRLERAPVRTSEDAPVPADDVFRELDREHGGRPAAVLRGARVKEDMTQAKLAEKLGIPQSNVAAMESGKRRISIDMAKRLAEILKVDYRVFL